MPNPDLYSDKLISTQAARDQLVSLAGEAVRMFQIVESASAPADPQDDAWLRLGTGLYVIALDGPSRELLAASADWSQRAADMSPPQAVLVATRLRLLRTRDEATKWTLLPAELGINVEQKVGMFDFDPRSADIVTFMARLVLPAVNAAGHSARRLTQQHHLAMTLEAIRMHAAQSGELPESLEDLQPVPALSELAAFAPVVYERLSPTTATIAHSPRWPRDREIVTIELITD